MKLKKKYCVIVEKTAYLDTSSNNCISFDKHFDKIKDFDSLEEIENYYVDKVEDVTENHPLFPEKARVIETYTI